MMQSAFIQNRLTNQQELKNKECQPPHKTSLTFERQSLTRHERCENHALRSRPFSLVVLNQTLKLVRFHSKRKLHKLSDSQLQLNCHSPFSKTNKKKRTTRSALLKLHPKRAHFLNLFFISFLVVRLRMLCFRSRI